MRGTNLFSGYWPDGDGGPDADGWFVTGDLAYRDDDGDLVLVGRDSELVLVNGFNVYPAEVESVLAALDGVSAAAVVGVPDAARARPCARTWSPTRAASSRRTSCWPVRRARWPDSSCRGRSRSSTRFRTR